MTKKQKKQQKRNSFVGAILKDNKTANIGDKTYAIKQTRGGYTAVRITYS